jgi:hypothetical protein
MCPLPCLSTTVSGQTAPTPATSEEVSLCWLIVCDEGQAAGTGKLSPTGAADLEYKPFEVKHLRQCPRCPCVHVPPRPSDRRLFTSALLSVTYVLGQPCPCDDLGVRRGHHACMVVAAFQYGAVHGSRPPYVWCETTSAGWTSEAVWLQRTDSEVHLTNREVISHQVLSANSRDRNDGNAKGR